MSLDYSRRAGGGSAGDACYHGGSVKEYLQSAQGLAFILDMDGVIINSTDLHTRAWEEYLLRHGRKDDSLMARMLGKRNDQIVHDIFGTELSPDEAMEHGFAKERLYREMMEPVFAEQLVPGVVDFIWSVTDAGIPLALATNAEPLNVDFVLDGAGVRDCFRAIVDGHQVEHAKPAPDVYLEAARRLGVETKNCIVFEDSPGGMTAARAAGARLVALLTTMENAPLADLAVPDFHHPDLAEWLERQRPA
jgi:beta-phosphoglucomutase